MNNKWLLLRKYNTKLSCLRYMHKVTSLLVLMCVLSRITVGLNMTEHLKDHCWTELNMSFDYMIKIQFQWSPRNVFYALNSSFGLCCYHVINVKRIRSHSSIGSAWKINQQSTLNQKMWSYLIAHYLYFIYLFHVHYSCQRHFHAEDFNI